MEALTFRYSVGVVANDDNAVNLRMFLSYCHTHMASCMTFEVADGDTAIGINRNKAILLFLCICSLERPA